MGDTRKKCFTNNVNIPPLIIDKNTIILYYYGIFFELLIVYFCNFSVIFLSIRYSPDYKLLKKWTYNMRERYDFGKSSNFEKLSTIYQHFIHIKTISHFLTISLIISHILSYTLFFIIDLLHIKSYPQFKTNLSTKC